MLCSAVGDAQCVQCAALKALNISDTAQHPQYCTEGRCRTQDVAHQEGSAQGAVNENDSCGKGQCFTHNLIQQCLCMSSLYAQVCRMLSLHGAYFGSWSACMPCFSVTEAFQHAYLSMAGPYNVCFHIASCVSTGTDPHTLTVALQL